MLINIVKIITLISLLASHSASAFGVLVRGATVESVGLYWNDADVYLVKVSGSSGPCANAMLEINESNYTWWPKQFDRTYSMLMSALISGKPIEVYGLSVDDCSSGSFVLISK